METDSCQESLQMATPSPTTVWLSATTVWLTGNCPGNNTMAAGFAKSLTCECISNMTVGCLE
ncbi:MAG TPA: hypothetical protein VEH06_04565 [Candidatus Bathyarchaeia archaeon]|nr:hypothetical protein [Candidatus Bathyarchaeia archaeon]